jgi:hypothetical protein
MTLNGSIVPGGFLRFSEEDGTAEALALRQRAKLIAPQGQSDYMKVALLCPRLSRRGGGISTAVISVAEAIATINRDHS